MLAISDNQLRLFWTKITFNHKTMNLQKEQLQSMNFTNLIQRHQKKIESTIRKTKKRTFQKTIL